MVQDDVEMEPTEKIGAQSSADNQMEDGTPKGPKHTQGTQNTLDLIDLDDDEDDNPAPCPKKTKHRKQSKKKAMIVDTDHFSSDDQVIMKKKPNRINLAASLDSDIEEIENPKKNPESPEEELGEW
jgi:hypothetical protein